MARLLPAIGVAVLGYVILLAYGVARPIVDSLFLEAHGSRWLPGAWAAVAVAMVIAVAAYNRFASRLPLSGLLVGGAVLSALGLVGLAGGRAAGLPGATLLLYVWKDVHVVVLLEILWSLANAVFRIQTARWAYGGFLVAGSLGGMSGNLIADTATAPLGSDGALWLAVPALLLVAALAPAVGRLAGHPRPSTQAARGRHRLAADVRLLRGSPYLGWLLALICIVQLVVTLIDYQYNIAIESAFPTTDARTRVMSRVDAAINVGSLALQLLTGPLLRVLAVPVALLAIPALLAAAVGAFALVPRFALMATAKVTSKVLDYSLFRAAKEILYIPLGYAEKTRGKALVDMLTYRVAKGGVSVLLLILAAATSETVAAVVMTALFALLAAWIAVTVRIVRRYRGLVSRELELRGRPEATPN